MRPAAAANGSAASRAVDVCMVMPSLVRGGVERVVLRLVDALDRSRYEPRLLLFEDDGRGYPRPGGVRVDVLRTASLRRHVLELAGIWRREPPGIVIAHTSGGSVVSLLARRLAGGRFPVVAVLHMPAGVAPGGREEQIMRLASRFAFRWADAVAAVSEGAADTIASSLRLPRARVRVLLNPVIDAGLDADAAAPVDHPWFRPGLRVVLGAGRLTAQKDFPTLLRAFARLAPEDDALRLVILGEGPDQDALVALGGELDVDTVVDLPGPVANPFAYMARSSVFVLSSAWEALPTVLIEALAVGVPVVSTDCVAGPREILLGGELGPLVPVGDDAALAAAIRTTLAAPPARDRLRARAGAFGRPAVAAYEALIDECLARRGRRRPA